MHTYEEGFTDGEAKERILRVGWGEGGGGGGGKGSVCSQPRHSF